MNDIESIEKRDQALRSSLERPTMAERDRRTLLAVIRRQQEAMREALTYLKAEGDAGIVDAAVEALSYALEQG